MTNQMIAERIKSVMAQIFEVPVSAISDDASPETIEQWDSLRHMNLILALEGEFKIEFTDQQIPEILSLSSIAKAVEQRLAVQK
jgi:acyl carrier protein